MAHAQTVINNGSNNTTQVFVQKAPIVIIQRSPPPPSFPYPQRELLPCMSARCAQLYEAQITSPSRRTGRTTGMDVREEFRLACPDAVSEAHKALYQVKLKSYDARQDAAMAQRQVVELSKATREQCDELLRILAGKRTRLPMMDDGERADHERSEANYRARCAA